MTESSDEIVRHAAARSLVNWNKEGYELRVAEWGVWINVDGQFKLAQSVIDEIPPFVHRTGNDLGEFVERLTIPTIVTKPIMHITANRSMPIDLEVRLNKGRPWFAFPVPDDFTLDAWVKDGYEKNLNDLKPDNPARLDAIQEGYPWIYPNHRQHSFLASR